MLKLKRLQKINLETFDFTSRQHRFKTNLSG